MDSTECPSSYFTGFIIHFEKRKKKAMGGVFFGLVKKKPRKPMGVGCFFVFLPTMLPTELIRRAYSQSLPIQLTHRASPESLKILPTELTHRAYPQCLITRD